jgi:DNA-binding NtrC family response regulator
MGILALISYDLRAAFERKAASYRLDVTFIASASELTALAHEGRRFSVAILPATLPDAGIWALWGQVQLLNPRPEILVYAPSADFSTWSGVLEAGGHDVLVEPYSAEELYSAVMKAEKTFEERLATGTADQDA